MKTIKSIELFGGAGGLDVPVPHVIDVGRLLPHEGGEVADDLESVGEVGPEVAR